VCGRDVRNAMRTSWKPNRVTNTVHQHWGSFRLFEDSINFQLCVSPPPPFSLPRKRRAVGAETVLRRELLPYLLCLLRELRHHRGQPQAKRYVSLKPTNTLDELWSFTAFTPELKQSHFVRVIVLFCSNSSMCFRTQVSEGGAGLYSFHL